MVTSLPGNSSDVKGQYSKASLLIVVNIAGRAIWVKALQFLKACSPMVLISDDSSTEVNAEQFSKADCGTMPKLSAITDSSALQS